MNEPHSLHDDIDLDSLTVKRVHQGLTEARFTAEALTQRCLGQIDACQASYNAMMFVNPAALDDAIEIASSPRGRRSAGSVCWRAGGR